MSLNLGSSNASSNSYSQSGGSSISMSSDNSRSSSQSTSGGFSRSNQTLAFEDIFDRLYGGASNAAKAALLGAPELTAASKQLFTGGNQFLQSLGNSAGDDYMNARLSGDNPELEEQINLLREDAGRLFTDELNPAITSRAVAGGTLGGGRQGVAQGMATEAVTREFVRGASALRMDDLRQRDQIAAQVSSNSLSAASTGLGALPSLLDILERGNNAELGTYSALSSILGGPTTLSQSESQQTAQSTSESIAEAIANSFASQQSSSRGRSRADSWNFGVGLGGG